jgi:hypothetical protein
MNSVTSDELLQYVYKETLVQRGLAIKAAIENNSRVHKEYLEIKSAKNNLNKLPLLSPPKEAVDRILRHAKKSLK